LILVTGFFSTGDDAASGNWGLHDQRLVLEWIRGNIDSFSGDPNRVTIFGEGAGAASVIFHLLSANSQRLFHRAIAQSGSALCDWAIERNPQDFARKVGETLGCPLSSSQQLVECMRTMSPSALLRAQSKFKVLVTSAFFSFKNLNYFRFQTFGEFPQRAAPVIEKPGVQRFISEDPRIIMERGVPNPVPLILGVNRDEASYFYPMVVDAHHIANKGYHEKELIPRFLEAGTSMKGDAKDRVVPSILFNYFNGVDLANLSSVATRFINVSSWDIDLYHSANPDFFVFRCHLTHCTTAVSMRP
jgi:carboxylesterase type B